MKKILMCSLALLLPVFCICAPVAASSAENKLIFTYGYGNILYSPAAVFPTADITRNSSGNLDNNALINASEDGDIKEVSSLIQAGANINFQNNSYGDTALIVASRYKHKEIVSMLLKAKADPNLQNDYGETALKLAKD